jgi:hypothetical protein
MINLEIMARARRLLDAIGRSAKQRTVKSRRVTISTHLNRSNDTVHFNSQPVWMETEARIVACNYAPARRKLWSLRSTTSCKTSIISFTYYAHARTYYGIFISHQTRVQGDTFPVYYNALNPQQNTLSPPKRWIRCALPEADLLRIHDANNPLSRGVVRLPAVPRFR